MARVLLALTLLLATCDADPAPGEPVGISSKNLAGYWLEVGTNSPTPTPMHLHFGVTTFAGETPPGLPTVEVDGVVVAGYELDQDYILATDAAGTPRFTARILSLTDATMTLHYGAHELTFERVDGCSGAGLWFSTSVAHTNTTDLPPAEVSVRDAVYGPDGALHLIISQVEGYQDAYAVVPPGRCTPWVPPLGPRGQSVDVASDGRIWVVRSRAVGELQLYEIPAAPWSRQDLATQSWVLEEDAMVSNTPPPTRVIEDEDGDPMVLWAYQQLHTTRVEGDTFVRDTVALPSATGLAPSVLTLEPFDPPSDGVLLRAGRVHVGLVFHRTGPAPGTWSEWKAETLPGGDGSILGGLATAFDVAPDGTLYAAWAGGPVGETILTLGRKPVGGDWETLPVGRGGATDLRVHDDGGVDIIGSLHPNGGALTWTHVPPGFTPDTWHQSYRPPTDTGTFGVAGASAAYALTAFGPRGEVLMGMPNSVAWWSRTTAEHHARRLYQEVALTFSNPTVTRVSFPTVGVECVAECTLILPVGAVLPVHIALDDPSDLRVVGTPAWSIDPDAVDGVARWQIIIPMTTTPLPSTPRRIPLAVEVTSWSP